MCLTCSQSLKMEWAPLCKYSALDQEKHIYDCQVTCGGKQITDDTLKDFSQWINGMVNMTASSVPTQRFFFSLDFSDNKISDEGFCSMLEILSENKQSVHLRVLKFFKNEIRDEGAKKLAEYIQKHDVALEEIHLSHNQITGVGARELIVAVANSRLYPLVKKASSVVRGSNDAKVPLWLRLESNNISDSKSLLQKLKVTPLDHPCVSGQAIGTTIESVVCFCERSGNAASNCAPFRCIRNKNGPLPPARIHLVSFNTQNQRNGVNPVSTNASAVISNPTLLIVAPSGSQVPNSPSMGPPSSIPVSSPSASPVTALSSVPDARLKVKFPERQPYFENDASSSLIYAIFIDRSTIRSMRELRGESKDCEFGNYCRPLSWPGLSALEATNRIGNVRIFITDSEIKAVEKEIAQTHHEKAAFNSIKDIAFPLLTQKGTLETVPIDATRSMKTLTQEERQVAESSRFGFSKDYVDFLNLVMTMSMVAHGTNPQSPTVLFLTDLPTSKGYCEWLFMHRSEEDRKPLPVVCDLRKFHEILYTFNFGLDLISLLTDESINPKLFTKVLSSHSNSNNNNNNKPITPNNFADIDNEKQNEKSATVAAPPGGVHAEVKLNVPLLIAISEQIKGSTAVVHRVDGNKKYAGSQLFLGTASAEPIHSKSANQAPVLSTPSSIPPPSSYAPPSKTGDPSSTSAVTPTPSNIVTPTIMNKNNKNATISAKNNEISNNPPNSNSLTTSIPKNTNISRKHANATINNSITSASIQYPQIIQSRLHSAVDALQKWMQVAGDNHHDLMNETVDVVGSLQQIVKDLETCNIRNNNNTKI